MMKCEKNSEKIRILGKNCDVHNVDFEKSKMRIYGTHTLFFQVFGMKGGSY